MHARVIYLVALHQLMGGLAVSNQCLKLLRIKSLLAPKAKWKWKITPESQEEPLVSSQGALWDGSGSPPPHVSAPLLVLSLAIAHRRLVHVGFSWSRCVALGLRVGLVGIKAEAEAAGAKQNPRLPVVLGAREDKEDDEWHEQG